MRGDEDALPGSDRRRDRILPVRQKPRHGVLQGLGEREVARIKGGVSRVVRRVARIVGRERWRRDVVASAPNLCLGLAVFGFGLRLVEPLQRPVVALVQSVFVTESTTDPGRRA